MKPLGLYLHIPFCASKCKYCDFYSLPAGEKTKDEFTGALCRHIESYKGLPGYEVDTVYLGGGTPSLLGGVRLRRIINTVLHSFAVSPSAEITVECNPDSVDAPLLRMLKKAGVNRLSLGVQSAHDDELQLLGRRHTWAQAKEAVRLAREAGFENLSLDLMYGLPGQSTEKFLASVDAVSRLYPTHLSCYGLRLEEGTPLALEQPVLPDDDAQADMYLSLCHRLHELGFAHYEVSNWARIGRRSRHNQKYWDLSEYLGLGPGAHSLFGGRRFAFPRSLKQYIAGSTIIEEEEPVPGFERHGEYLMLRLRTSDGVSPETFTRLFGRDFAPYERCMQLLEKHGLAMRQQERWRLTERGFLVSNSVIRFVLDAPLRPEQDDKK